MKKVLLFTALSLLCISFVTGFTLTGCGDNAVIQSVTPNPIASSTPFTTTVPMPDQPLNILREEGSKSLFSMGIGLIMDGLKEGLTITIAENTTGRVLDIIGKQFGIGAGQENRELADTLKAMDQKLDMIIDQLNSIESDLTALQNQLSITTVVLKDYITSTSLQSDISYIKTVFNTTSPVGLIYYSDAGSKLDPNEDPNSPLMQDLKNGIVRYCEDNRTTVEANVQHMHDMICPDLASLDGVLKNYTDDIILNPTTPNQTLLDPGNAMKTYCLLENFFAQILNYQTKGCIIITEINNYYYPTADPNGPAASYFNGTYKTLIREEIIQYLKTVNYLVINLSDYRNTNNFNNQSQNMFSTGLIHDDTYLMVLARARFFCAQIMDCYGDNSGLYGTIITPFYYDTDSANPTTSVTLQFSGPTTATKTVQAQKILGQYPYTRWYKDPNNLIHCCPDNNWSCYDFSSDPNNSPYISIDPSLPGGTYTVSLVDNGNNKSPWYHSQTNLGQVTIKYYDPNNLSSSTATTYPTETNTFKFGYFSSRWYWGYNKISLSPMSEWLIPSSHDVYYNNYKDNEDNPTYHGDFDPDQKTISPIDGTFPVFGLSLDGRSNDIVTSSKMCLAYKIKFPFIVDGVPGDTADKANAKLYYLLSSEVNYTSTCKDDKTYLSSCQYYYYHLRDTDKDDEKKIIDDYKEEEYAKSSSSYDDPVYNSGIATIDLYKDHKQELRIDAGGNCINGGGKYVFSIHTNLYWAMQVVYGNRYTNIFN